MTDELQDPPEGSYAKELLLSAQKADLIKSERTRLRLLAALAVRLDNEDPLDALRITDVAQDAGVAHGTFYRYFTDQEAAIAALMNGFIEFFIDRLTTSRVGLAGSPERVHNATLTYIALFRTNTGLMRRLMSLEAKANPIRERFHALNREWSTRMATAIAARRAELSGSDAEPIEQILPVAYALGGMVDEFLAQIYLRRDPALLFLSDDPDAIATHVTDAWCYGAYGKPGSPKT